MKLEKGAVVVVCEMPDAICTVEIEQAIAPVPGRGWLYFTKEGNVLFVEPTTAPIKTSFASLQPARFVFVAVEDRHWTDVEAIIESLPPRKTS